MVSSSAIKGPKPMSKQMNRLNTWKDLSNIMFDLMELGLLSPQ